MVQRLRAAWLQVLVSAAVVALFLAHPLGYFDIPFVAKLELLAYDARLKFHMPRGVDDRIVVVDIDERSLAREGRWPWGRDKLARMVDELFDTYGVAILGFDVVFAEPDESSGLIVLEGLAQDQLSDNEAFHAELDRLRPSLDRDAIFAKSLANRPVVLGYYFSDATDLSVGKLPAAFLHKDDFSGRRINFAVAGGYSANLNELQDVALAAGHFTPTVDEDGVVRRIPLLYEFDGSYYEALALAIARVAVGANSLSAGFPEESKAGGTYQGMEWLELGDRRIPVDASVRALVPYRGPQGSFTYVSATDVLNGKASRDQFEGRIVLVGTSAPGLLDLRSTPVQSPYPGVEVHANLVAGILDGTILQDPEFTLGANAIVLVLFGLVLTFCVPIVRPLTATIATFAALGLFSSVNIWAWREDELLLSVVPGLAMITFIYLFNMSYGFFVESRGKRQLAGLFGQYIPPELVDEMSVNPADYSMTAQSREMTVLFTDVRGFTTISEALNPQELSSLMSEFLTPMTELIHDHRGTIDKYMGDAVMCFWGAPLRDPEHALRAILCALDMVAAVHALAPKFRERGWPPITIGVGVNTGEMHVGDMGSRFRRAYTVLGDAVNLGSRLEGKTKDYGVDIIVSETVRAAARGTGLAFRELDRIIVKGKHEPVTIYEPLGMAEAVTSDLRDEIRLCDQAMKLYRAQSWDSAEIQFLNLKNAQPDRRLYNLYIDRIKEFRAKPPGDNWDGAYTFDTK